MAPSRMSDEDRIEKQIRQKTYKNQHIDRTTKKKRSKKTDPPIEPETTTTENGT